MTLSDPIQVQERLEGIERELGERQNKLETAAKEWGEAKHTRELEHAKVFVSGDGTVTDRRAKADIRAGAIGSGWETEYDVQKRVIDVLKERATICMSLLKAQKEFS